MLKFSLIAFVFTVTFVYAQIPSKCFEIESILVDGCDGANEGKNEMVIFQNGPLDLDVNDLRVDGAGASGVIQTGVWPNTSNNFLGFCTDPVASANLAILNAGITQCGFLREPTAGIIPAGAHVLILTSTEYTAIPTYFENLSDTMYVIFQCAGNTGGHFANFGTTSVRTLVLTNTATNCADTVFYDRSFLELADGTLGAEDGGSVGYDWQGNPDYFNNGCQAPLVPSSVTFNGDSEICPGETAEIIANISGTYSTIVWSGGTGSFNSNSNDTTTYTPNSSETGLITLNLKAFDPCGNLKIDEDFSFTIKTVNAISITADFANPVCTGDTLTLYGNGGTTYLWSTGENTDSIKVVPSSDSTFTVGSLNNGCPVTAEIDILVQNCDIVIPFNPEISFPNVFTPNGDLTNELFTPTQFEGVVNQEFVILNRWGQIVYQSNDQIIIWDGKIDGKDASEGVYFYVETYTDFSLETKTLHGFFHLIRK